jgi:hypothetical protein
MAEWMNVAVLEAARRIPAKCQKPAQPIASQTLAAISISAEWLTFRVCTGSGRQATVKMMRLSCHRSRRMWGCLWLGALAGNSGNLWHWWLLPRNRELVADEFASDGC